MKELQFYRYLNDKSILVLTPAKQLKRIYCPFKVMDLNKKIMNVESVVSRDGVEIYYQVNGETISYKDLKIIFQL